MKKIILFLLAAPSFIVAMNNDEPVMICSESQLEARPRYIDLARFPKQLKNNVSKLVQNEFRYGTTTKTIPGIFSNIPIQFTYFEYFPQFVEERNFLDPKDIFVIGKLIERAQFRYQANQAYASIEDSETFINKIREFYIQKPHIPYRSTEHSDTLLIKNIENLSGTPAGRYLINYFTTYLYEVLNAAKEYEKLNEPVVVIDAPEYVHSVGYKERQLHTAKPFEMPQLPPFDYSQISETKEIEK